MSAAGIYIARETFICEIDGVQYNVARGERVRAGHRLLDQQRERFDPVDDTVTYEVEQATAAPGEKRGMSPRRTGA